GLEHALVRGLKIAPNFIVMRQNNIQQFNVGTYFIADIANNQYAQQANHTKIIVGGWHRFNDSMIFMVGLQSKNVASGISFDLNSSNLRYQTRGRGAFEISASYKISKGNGIRRLSTPLI
nr:type IX secretion system membrane protein PorP/SprF [Bacteroidota bacterium]